MQISENSWPSSKREAQRKKRKKKKKKKKAKTAFIKFEMHHG
jgi:hypothetical protein